MINHNNCLVGSCFQNGLNTWKNKKNKKTAQLPHSQS